MPKKALSDLAIKRMKPPAKGQVDMFDMGYPGFALRLSYGGAKSWVYFYRMGDRQRRLTLGHYPSTSLSEAREKWRKAKEDLDLGKDPARKETSSDNFESVAREWLKRDQAHNKTVGEVTRILEKEFLPSWRNRSIKDISRHDILLLLDAIADRGSLTMARRVAAYIHRLFRWSVSRGIIEFNPAADLPKPGREISRERVLTDDELKAVWKAAGEVGWPYGDAIRLLILTGARRGEISGLRWSEVQDDCLRLPGERTKNGEAQTFPLSKPALAIIEGLPRIAGSEFVFGREIGKGAWSQAKKTFPAKIAPWRIHDLRRTVSTGMNELGTEPHIVEAVLGHKVAGVAGVYNRAKYEEAKRTALEAWGAHVVSLVEGKNAGKVIAMQGAS